MDLIKTIEEGQEVRNYSESSEDEEELFQPKKKSEGSTDKNSDFSLGFEFLSNNLEYNADTWNDLSKYIRIKKNKIEKTDLQEKIRNARKSIRSNEKQKANKNPDEGGEFSSETSDADGVSLSEDDLKKDFIKGKEKKGGRKRKRKKGEESEEDESKEIEKMEFEDAPPFDESTSFQDMNLSRPLLKAINELGFDKPTPIQSSTIPVALLGRDVAGCAATGTGKTAAYMLPTLERLLYRPASGVSVTRVLVVVPTRELGVQVYQVSRQLSRYTSIEIGLSVGGLDLKLQESILRKNPDVVIATPGRLIDHMKNTPSFCLESVEVLILDEADRMLDEYFQEQMKEILSGLRRERQTLLFSATMTEAVEDLAAVSLKNPVRIFVDSNQQVASGLRQEFVKIRSGREGDREAILAALVCRTFNSHAMVFVQTKKEAHRLVILLGLLGAKAGELHGNLTQTQRLAALEKFKKGESDILVATDLAARGLDIRGVATVLNFLLPATLEQYIHRVGRTGRAGKRGVSVSLVGEGERGTMKKIIKTSENKGDKLKIRLIPGDVLDRYRKRVEGLEVEIKNILDEEWAEKELTKAEAREEKLREVLTKKKKKNELPTVGKGERLWFQTRKTRKLEKDRLRLVPGAEVDGKGKKGRGQRRKKKNENEGEEKGEERVQRELQQVSLLQARIAKAKSRPKKIKKMVEGSGGQERNRRGKNNETNVKRKKKSSFAEDLTDVSKKGVKKMRYVATKFKNDVKFGRSDDGGKTKKKKKTNLPFNNKNKKKK